VPGAGGFINISQNAQRLVFMGTFASSSRCRIEDGKLLIADENPHPKFQRTFSGPYAAAAGQSVLYVTERCVFRLITEGLELTEIAPGVDVERDVLARMGFAPIIRVSPS
jgi:propionate CoA-transferase